MTIIDIQQIIKATEINVRYVCHVLDSIKQLSVVLPNLNRSGIDRERLAVFHLHLQAIVEHEAMQISDFDLNAYVEQVKSNMAMHLEVYWGLYQPQFDYTQRSTLTENLVDLWWKCDQMKLITIPGDLMGALILIEETRILIERLLYN